MFSCNHLTRDSLERRSDHTSPSDILGLCPSHSMKQCKVGSLMEPFEVVIVVTVIHVVLEVVSMIVLLIPRVFHSV